MSDEKNLEHANTESIEELEGLKNWWNEHGNIVSGILCAVLVVIIGYNFYTRHVESKEADASSAYTTAASAADMEAVIGQYPKSAVVPLARLRLGNEYFHTQQYDMARSSYETFLKDFPKHDFVPVALLGLAHVTEAEGNFSEAEKMFEGFISDNAGHYLVPLATLGEARCLTLTDRKDEARSLLDRMMAERAGTPWSSYADELLSAIPRLRAVAPKSSFDDALKALAGQEAAVAADTNSVPSEPAADAK